MGGGAWPFLVGGRACVVVVIVVFVVCFVFVVVAVVFVVVVVFIPFPVTTRGPFSHSFEKCCRIEGGSASIPT